MGSSLTLEYALPVSALRFNGAVTTTYDTLLDADPTHARSGTVTLDVVAGKHRRHAVFRDRLLRDTSASFTVTEDGRLLSANVETTGQVGKVVLGVAAAAANIAGLAAGVPPGVLGGFLKTEGEDLTPDQRVAAAYAAAFPDVAVLRQKYEALVRQAVSDIAETAERLFAATDYAARANLLSRLAIAERQLPVLRSELARLELHYGAWRAGTLSQHTETHERVVTLDTLRAAGVHVDADGEVQFDAQAGEVRDLWELLGLTVVMSPSGSALEVPQPDGDNVILVREPRVATLFVYERGGDGRARLQRSVEQLVIDSACPTRAVELSSSWFAKRSGTLTFSALGNLTGLSHSAGSSAAAVAGTLGELPETVAGSLETATKIRASWVGMHDARLDEELARTKKDIELKQQQLTAAGLAATSDQHAELARLTQQADMLAKRKLIGDAGLDAGARNVSALKQEVELLKGQKDLSEAARGLAAEQQLYELRLEIERLKAEKDRRDNQPSGTGG